MLLKVAKLTHYKLLPIITGIWHAGIIYKRFLKFYLKNTRIGVNKFDVKGLRSVLDCIKIYYDNFEDDNTQVGTQIKALLHIRDTQVVVPWLLNLPRSALSKINIFYSQL